MTMAGSKQLAMMTPQPLLLTDPFERNSGRFRKTPNEGTLFHGLAVDYNDMWDATSSRFPAGFTPC